MTGEKKTTIENVTEKYLKLPDKDKMFVLGIMQGMLLKTTTKDNDTDHYKKTG